MSIDKKNLGKRLAEARKRNSMTLEQVVKKCDKLTAQMLCSYEKGNQIPRIDKLANFAKIYNVSLDYLCFGEENTVYGQMQQNTKKGMIMALMFMFDHGFLEGNVYTVGGEDELQLASRDKEFTEFFRSYIKLSGLKGQVEESVYNGFVKSMLDKYNHNIYE